MNHHIGEYYTCPVHKTAFQYFIGEEYTYPGRKRRFKLVEVDGYKFKFECGHSVTDNVFWDLVRVKTGIQVFEDNQLLMF
jgi:hypothetical protein